MDWLKLALKKRELQGQTICKVTGEGCQAMNKIQWIGKVTGFQFNTDKEWEEVIIEIMLHDCSYGDARGNEKPEIYTYPLVNNDIQCVKGVWILFT